MDNPTAGHFMRLLLEAATAPWGACVTGADRILQSVKPSREIPFSSRAAVMMTDGSFDSFIAKIRSGDEAAAKELVTHFEGVIRREVRLRLNDRRLLRVFDSMDISQSVLTSFFTRAGTGQFEIETPEQLIRLLIGMTRNKLAFEVRRQRALRRDGRLNASGRVEEMALAAQSPGPSQLASDRDLIDAMRLRLGEEERQLADLRAQGWQWAEIAERLGGSPQSRRMQLSRAVQRVAKELKMSEKGHD